MAEGPIYLLVATYADEAPAWADYDSVKTLHHSGVVGTYDAAVVTRGGDGKVHVHKREKPTQHAAWTGIGVGAVIGLLFPLALIGTAVAGGLAGGLIGHLWKGMSRKQVREIGRQLDAGQAALIVIGPSSSKTSSATPSCTPSGWRSTRSRPTRACLRRPSRTQPPTDAAFTAPSSRHRPPAPCR